MKTYDDDFGQARCIECNQRPNDGRDLATMTDRANAFQRVLEHIASAERYTFASVLDCAAVAQKALKEADEAARVIRDMDARLDGRS